ncbi:MAG: hypothetical protein WCH31_05110 [Actinomycetes bacterium]
MDAAEQTFSSLSVAVEYREEPCKSALNRVSGMGFGWSLNPCMGCSDRCTFCYVRAFKLRADRPFDARCGTSLRIKVTTSPSSGANSRADRGRRKASQSEQRPPSHPACSAV